MADSTTENKGTAEEDPTPDDSLDNEAREAGESVEEAKKGRGGGSSEKKSKFMKVVEECSDILYLFFAKRLERVYKIISGDLSYGDNWWSSLKEKFSAMGAAAPGIAHSLFMSALCAFYNNSSGSSMLSALKAALFLSLSFAPEHKLSAQEKQIKTTKEATESVIDQIKKMLDRYKPAAPPYCFDDQSKVIALVVEDYKGNPEDVVSVNSGEDKVEQLDIERETTINNSLVAYNILERTAEKQSDIVNNNLTEEYSASGIFPRPRVTGFYETLPTRYYVVNSTSDSGITTSTPVNLSKNNATLSGDLEEVSLGNNYEIYFKWGKVSTGGWNTTEKISVTESTSFSQEIDGLDSTEEYEYQAFVDIYTDNVFEETREGEVVNFTPSTDSISRTFTWDGAGRAVSTSILIEGEDKNTKPNIKESVVHPLNTTEYSLDKPSSLSENDMLLIIDNSHRSNRTLENPGDFNLIDHYDHDVDKGLPRTSIYYKKATASEPDQYDLTWRGQEGGFIEDHTNPECHKGLIDKLEELGDSLRRYDDEKEKEQMEQIGKEIRAMAECIDFVMERADEILEDDPQKRVNEIEDYESIKDQLDTIEEAGFDTSAENINLSSMGNFLERKQNELENMKSPERDLDEDEKFEWNGSEVLSDNMKLEFLKNIRDAFKDIRNVLAMFKRFMQELSSMNVMMPGQISIDALKDFIDGLNSELFDLADVLEEARVNLKITSAEKVGEIGGMLDMLDDLGEDLYDPDAINEASDFLDDINDELSTVEDLFSVIYRAIPYVLYGEESAQFLTKIEDLFGEPAYQKFSTVKDLIKDLKSDSETVGEFYENELKTWSGVFTIFTAWFDDGDSTKVNLIDKAMFFLTRVIENLNRVIDGEAPIEDSEVDRFGKQLAEIFKDIRNDLPLEMIIGVLELYLSLYQMVNFFDNSRIKSIEENLEALNEALPEDGKLSESFSNGDFESLLNSEGGLASCFELIALSLKESAVELAQSYSEEEEGDEGPSNLEEALARINKWIENAENAIDALQSMLNFDISDQCDGQESYAEKLQGQFDNLKKGLDEITSLPSDDDKSVREFERQLPSEQAEDNNEENTEEDNEG